MSEREFKQGSLRAAAAKAKINQVPNVDPATGRMLTIAEKQELFAKQQAALGQPQTPNVPANGPRIAQAASHNHNKGKHPPQPPKPFKYICGHAADIAALQKNQCKECKQKTQERRRERKKEKRKAKKEKDLKEQGLLVEAGGPPVLRMGHDKNWRLPHGSMFSNLLYTKEDEEGHKWAGSLIIAQEGWDNSEEHKQILRFIEMIHDLFDQAVKKKLVLKFNDTSSGVMKMLSKLDRQYRRHLDPMKFQMLDELKKQREAGIKKPSLLDQMKMAIAAQGKSEDEDVEI